MDLIEREGFLSSMQKAFNEVVFGEGHCLLVSGEAGIGKTSVVRAFCKSINNKAKIYQGSCDALFTPRPLGPVLDIIWQLGEANWEDAFKTSDRSAIFSRFHFELANMKDTTVIVIEDIHWADEATLDFIKFFARRINRLHCLLILTFREDEVHTHHLLRTVLGQLQRDSFTRLQLTPLSRAIVGKLSEERGYNGEEVYTISGGNPFYVNEILASYSVGVPENVRDSVLSSFSRLNEQTKRLWEFLSVIPTGFEIRYIEKMDPSYPSIVHNYLDLKILVSRNGLISFKHELYRRTIESSLSPLVRISLNKLILELFRENFEANGKIELIIHHAKNANENEIVVKYAPLAAQQAAKVGAHIEAARLHLTAIEYFEGENKDTLIRFYESYAYECYLTNQLREAIIYTGKALNLWKEKQDIEKTGDCMRFLSRLWWYDGNRKHAEEYAAKAIEVLNPLPSSRAKAMALSNMSQLKMLSYDNNECITWGEKAIAMAKELNDDEILCHALNNVGTTQSRLQASRTDGTSMLQKSLDIALRNSYDDHVARAYINLSSVAVKMKDYAFANIHLEDGILYCEDRDLDTYTSYLLAFKARLLLETGKWQEARQIVETLVKDESQPVLSKIEALVIAATIRLRKGDADPYPLLLEAREKAFATMEPQRVIPAITAFLEYEWLKGTAMIRQDDLDYAISMLSYEGHAFEKSEFVYWLMKARGQKVELPDFFEGFKAEHTAMVAKHALVWKKLECPYEQALLLFEGNEDNKRTAIEILHKLEATVIAEKLKAEMRSSGIKSIPRGIRESTRSNPANLTERELDVLQLLKNGLRNKEIAASLFISAKTVDHHITSIYFKLDVNSRARAVQAASQLKIVK